MTDKVSSCCFIRDCFTGAFCIFESMASLLPFVDEMVILDLGSTDGTRQILIDIAESNPQVKVILGEFPKVDAGVFADLANDLIDFVQYDNVIYWQADEVWHEDLLALMSQRFERGEFDLSFWRIQYANNFQYVKWFPHLVHRVSHKKNFHFDGDGMNTNRVWDAKICSDFGGEMFQEWGKLGQEGITPYTNQMITDISLIGAFRDNIPERRRMHAPFWNEEPTIPYHENGKQPHLPQSAWMERALSDPDWTKTASPYQLPHILHYHIGKTKYELRPELLVALKKGDTRGIVGL